MLSFPAASRHTGRRRPPFFPCRLQFNSADVLPGPTATTTCAGPERAPYVSRCNKITCLSLSECVNYILEKSSETLGSILFVWPTSVASQSSLMAAEPPKCRVAPPFRPGNSSHLLLSLADHKAADLCMLLLFVFTQKS